MTEVRQVVNKFEELIGKTFPELIIKEFSMLGKGKACIVFLVNNEIVFKIPLQSRDSAALKNEAKVLRFLDGMPEVPKILYSATAENGLYILGETLLPGITLSYELCDTFDKATNHDILHQLGRLVRKIHEAGGNDSSWHGGESETLEDLINRFNNRLCRVQGLFEASELDKMNEMARTYFDITSKHPVQPVLCHHDLHFLNLMFDPENKKITGILDFGCAGYAEPAMDWYYYFDAKAVLEGYGDTGDEYFSERQQFHALSHLLGNLGDEITEKPEPYMTLEFIRDYIL